MSEVSKTGIGWRKILTAIAVLVLVGWIFTVGFGHGGGSTGTTTINLRTGP
jgi:hypothetical protein